MFLKILLDHPSLKEHELLWEFLTSELDVQSICQRTKLKVDYLLEHIFKTFPKQVNTQGMSQDTFFLLQNTHYKNALHRMDLQLDNFKELAVNFRKVAKSKREQWHGWKIFNFEISRPTSLLLHTNVLPILYKTTEDMTITREMSDWMVEVCSWIAGAQSVIPRHEQATRDFQNAARD